MLNTKSLFIFDLGNVVLNNISFLTNTAKLIGVDPNKFKTDYQTFDIPLMISSITFYEYWQHVEKKFNIKIQGNPFEKTFHPVLNPIAIKLVNQLHEADKTVVLGSNTFAPHYNYVMQMGWNKYFDHFYASHLMKIAKPSLSFYNYILRAENTSANNTFFIDDLEENIKGAKVANIDGFCYTNDQEFENFFEL